MRTHLIPALFCFILMTAVFACQKEAANPRDKSSFDFNLMRNKTWVEYFPNNPTYDYSMKLRFFGDSSVTYTYQKSILPTRYDSIVNGVWTFIKPDTMSFHKGSYYFGGFNLISINDSIMKVKIYSYRDTSLFKAIK